MIPIRCSVYRDGEGIPATIIHFSVGSTDTGDPREVQICPMAVVMFECGNIGCLPLDEGKIRIIDAKAIEQEAADNVPRSIPRVEVTGREVWGVEFRDGPVVALKGTTTRLGCIDFPTPIAFTSEKQALSAAEIIAAFHKCQARPVRFREVL